MAQHQYINADKTVFGDAYAMMRLNKNILLKGPTGSGKTKLAESLSEEINMAKPETLPILNGVLDYRRSLTNPFTGEIIKAKPGFNVIAAINEGYVGTLPMNEALKNRFVVIHVDYIDGETLKTVIKEQSRLDDDALISKIVAFNEDLRTMTKQGQISEEAASIRALIDMSDLATVMPIERAIQRAIIDKLEDEREQQAIINAIELNF